MAGHALWAEKLLNILGSSKEIVDIAAFAAESNYWNILTRIFRDVIYPEVNLSFAIGNADES